jgi:ElaB/YqjD/DUF883 family membrane-anchored ribosome-binding protein
VECGHAGVGQRLQSPRRRLAAVVREPNQGSTMSMHREDYIALIQEYPRVTVAVVAFIVGIILGLLV